VAGVSLSSDFIAGFCGETEEDHLQTVSLLREVQYNMGFLFAYSMRQVSPSWDGGETTSVMTTEFLTGFWLIIDNWGEKKVAIRQFLRSHEDLNTHFFISDLINLSTVLYSSAA
ncbi:unnamed protein product, partial [Gulo gulo]